jgi:4'-phosphopantetheinyl transferase EntD
MTLAGPAPSHAVDCAPVLGLTPLCVAVEEDWIGAVAGRVWPDELAHVANAVDGRRAEFGAGRVLARRALASLGCADCPIPVGPDRMPVWPRGFTGSISHSRDRVAVGVGKMDEILAIGIDIEDAGRFRPELERRIALDHEIALYLDGRSQDARQSALAVLFSVKEAFYKCQYAISRQFLDFHDVQAGIDFARQEFEIIPLTQIPLLAGAALRGRFRIKGGAVAAAMVLERGNAPWLA